MPHSLYQMSTGSLVIDYVEYHWVRPSVMFDRPDMDTWCNETFGEASRKWFRQSGRYFFRNENHRSWFMLRWSS